MSMEIIKFPVKRGTVVNKVYDTAYNVSFSFKHIKFLTIRPHGGTYSALHSVWSNEDFLDHFKNIIHNVFNQYAYVGSIEKNKDIGYHCHLMVDCSTSKLNKLKELNLDKFDVLHKYGMKQHCWMVSKPNGNLVRGAIYFLGCKTNQQNETYKKDSYTVVITNCKERIFQPINEDIRTLMDAFTNGVFK